jgi:hypothetical protein
MQLLMCSSVRLLWAGSAIGTVLLASIIIYVVRLLEWYKKEAVISYEITAPTPPGDGTVLEKPSIEVRIPESRSRPHTDHA